MVSFEEFDKFCESIFDKSEQEKFQIIKSKRKKINITIFTTESVLLVITFLLGYFLLADAAQVVFAISMPMAGAFVIGMTVLIVCFAVPTYNWSALKDDYCEQVIDFLLKGYKYTYNENAYISEKEYKKSEYSGYYDSYRGEDLLEIFIPNDDGSVSQTKLVVSDLKVSRDEKKTVTKKDSNGNTVTETVTETIMLCSGIFGYVKFEKPFKCFLAINRLCNHKELKLEDSEFNKKFSVYASNEIEALKILTPTLMDKLKKHDEYAGRFEFWTKDEYLYFTGWRHLFEIRCDKNGPDKKCLYNFYNDITSLLMIVEEIKTNNKVFSTGPNDH